MKQLALNIGQTTLPSFANFWIGSNAAAVSALAQITGTTKTAQFQSMVLWGDRGSGRSHLLQALSAATGWPFLNPQSPLAAFAPDLTKRACIIDDLDRLNHQQLQAAFVLWADLHARADQSTTIVVSIANSPMQLGAAGMRPDMASRLAQALVFEIRGLSDAEKLDALRARFHERGLVVNDEVLQYLLNRLPRHMPSLVAAVDALDKLGWEHKRAISLPLLREWLKQMHL